MRFVPSDEFSSVVGVLRDVEDWLFQSRYWRLSGISLYCSPDYCVPILLLPGLDGPFVGFGVVFRRRRHPHYLLMK